MEENSIIGIIFLILIVMFISSTISSNKREEEDKLAIAELSERYYYNQLNSGYKKYGKAIYNELYCRKEDLKSGKTTISLGDQFSDMLKENHSEGRKELCTSFYAAIEAFQMENPDMFFIDINKMTLNIIESDEYRVTIDKGDNDNYFIDGITSRDDVKKMEEEISTHTSNIMQELKNLNDDYSKIKKVHDYLIDTIEYDVDEDEKHRYNIYGALVNKKCVCSGYALAFQYFMNQLNIDSMYVEGVANIDVEAKYLNLLPINHAWNYVKLNDNWYAVDTTWDDPRLLSGAVLTENRRYEFFLKGSQKMNESHYARCTLGSDGSLRVPSFETIIKTTYLVKEDFTFPVLSLNDY